eukprot:14727966-Heterocapsa_arctica.AAC.1
MQDDEDTNVTANEWIEFFQQEADNEVPDICQDLSQYGWRTSGSGTARGKDSGPEDCYCGAICTCMRRFGSRRHTHRSSLRASWIRARKDLRETEGDEYWRQLCIRRHPGIDAMDLSGSDEEAWEAHVRKQVQIHEDRVRQLREEGLRRVGLGSG